MCNALTVDQAQLAERNSGQTPTVVDYRDVAESLLS
jgi:hypothetical protein